MTDQELYEAMGIQHFDGGGYADMLTAKNMNATEDAPMPEVLAKNGHEVVPIYEKKSLGQYGATYDYGKPTGYYYDNGHSTYVFTDAAGNITGEKARTDAWTSFREGFLKPAAAVVAAAYGAPYLSEALGAAGAAGTITAENAAALEAAYGTGAATAGSAAITGTATASGMAGTLGMSAGPLATAVNTAFANGGMEAVREVVSKEGLDINKILASAGRGAITSGATSLVSNAVNSAGIDVGNTTVNNLVNKGLTTATVASIMGGDWKKALAGMGLNEATGLVAKQIPGFDKLPKEVQSVVTSTIGTGLRGGNMSDAALQNAINMGIKVGADSGAAWLKDLVPKDAANAVTDVLKTAGLQEIAGSVLTTIAKKPATPQNLAQAVQEGYMSPKVLAKIKAKFDISNPLALSEMTVEDLVKSVQAADNPEAGAENPIYAAQGGSIDDLIEYLRR